MVNKKWYEELEEDELWTREYLQELIGKYCFNYYNVVEDITPENVVLFLGSIFKQYEGYRLCDESLIDIGDALCLYFHKAFKDEFPDTSYPSYHKKDKRNIAMNIISYMYEGEYVILPKDVPELLNYLNTSENNVMEAYDKFAYYLSNFDNTARNYENKALCSAIQQQRAEAQAKGEPEPQEPDKELMFKILTGKLSPASIPATGYTEPILANLCPEQDYCVTISNSSTNPDKKELDIHKKDS